MGRRKFGPQTGEWPDDGWRGWWGDEPPFRTPVFIMSHHEHPSIEFPNGTTFHFVNAPPHEVLHLAQKATNGRDVRIGGGPSTVRQFLHADLIDFMHLVIVPITLGRGVSLWEGLSGLEDRFTVETLTIAQRHHPSALEQEGPDDAPERLTHRAPAAELAPTTKVPARAVAVRQRSGSRAATPGEYMALRTARRRRRRGHEADHRVSDRSCGWTP